MNKIQRLLLLPLICVLLLSACSRTPMMSIYGKTMGTWYTIKVHDVKDDHEQERLQLAIDAALTRIDLSVNTYNSKSQISKFNAYHENGGFPVSKDFIRIARTAKEVYINSEGAFDPTVKPLVKMWGFGDNGIEKKPTELELEEALEHVAYDKLRLIEDGIIKKDPMTELDFSAIAKGYGVDLVLEEIKALGYENILVEIGGEVRVSGKNGKRPWRIGIAIPNDNNVGIANAKEVIDLVNMACATSGDYQQYYIHEGEKYSHLINPKTGYPIRHEVTSVTVIAENCMLADACATAAIVLGKEKGLAFIESMKDVEAYFIYRDGEELKTVQSKGWE